MGQNYAIFCNATGENVTIYTWKRGEVKLNEMEPILFFSAFTLSHAGTYSCIVNDSYIGYKKVTIQSMPGAGNCMRTNFTLLPSVLVPAPESVNLLSNKTNPIHPVGSDVNLTCIVELNPTIINNVSLLTADIQLSRNENPLALIGMLTRTGTTITYTTQLNSFGRNDSGNYTCTATIRSQPTTTHLTASSSLTNSAKISTG